VEILQTFLVLMSVAEKVNVHLFLGPRLDPAVLPQQQRMTVVENRKTISRYHAMPKRYGAVRLIQRPRSPPQIVKFLSVPPDTVVGADIPPDFDGQPIGRKRFPVIGELNPFRRDPQQMFFLLHLKLRYRKSSVPHTLRRSVLKQTVFIVLQTEQPRSENRDPVLFSLHDRLRPRYWS